MRTFLSYSAMLVLVCSAGCVLPDFEKGAADGGSSGTGGGKEKDAGEDEKPLAGKACGLSDKLPRSCDACIRKECCDLAKACPAGSDCGKDLLEPITPVADFSKDFDPLLGCMQSHCNAECEVDWGCVGNYTWPIPKDDYSFKVHVVDFAAQPQVAIPGVTVDACNSIDPACKTGLVNHSVTDKKGFVTMTVPPAFNGYFSFSGGDHAPCTAQWSEPAFRVGDFTQFQLSTLALQGLAAATGVHSTPEQQFADNVGHLIFRVQGCVPLRFLDNTEAPRAEVANASVDFGKEAGASRVFYTDKTGGVSLELNATTIQGVGGAFNLPARNITVTAKDDLTGRDVASGTAVIRPGAIGFIYLLPDSE